MALQNVLKLDPAEQILRAPEYLAARAAERIRLEGKLEGNLEGRVSMLSKQLEQRFGPRSESARKRLQTATATELDAMLLRVLNAASIDEVLGKPKRTPKKRATP